MANAPYRECFTSRNISRRGTVKLAVAAALQSLHFEPRDMLNRSGARWFNVSDGGINNRRTASLAGLAVALLIIVGALLIVRKLQVRCLIENCILAGGTHCEHVADDLRVSRSIEMLEHKVGRWIGTLNDHATR